MANEELEQRKIKSRKKARIYLYAGFILFLIGAYTLVYSQLGFIIIAGGVFMRVLYYMAKADIRSIDRLASRLKIVTSLLIPLLLCLFAIAASALQPGQKAAELDGLNWLKGEQFKIFHDDAKNAKIVVIECWATWDKGCQLAAPVLSNIQKKYEDDILIVGISKEKEDALKSYLKIYDKNISYRIAQDPTGTTMDYYAGADARIPLALVVGKDGKILYRGHPMELENVLKNILDGTFDAEKQQKITQLHKELQDFLQLEDIKQAINTSEKILALDPTDDIAMRVRLYVFESRKELPKALMFVNKQITKNPKTAPLYFIKLDLMQRTNLPLEKLHAAMKKIAELFKDDPDALHQLAWIAVNRIRFGSAPLETILQASKDSVDLMINAKVQDPAKLAKYLNTQAKVFYMAGMVDQAVITQEKACRLLLNEPGENEAQQLLQYYKSARQLKKQEDK